MGVGVAHPRPHRDQLPIDDVPSARSFSSCGPCPWRSTRTSTSRRWRASPARSPSGGTALFSFFDAVKAHPPVDGLRAAAGWEHADRDRARGARQGPDRRAAPLCGLAHAAHDGLSARSPERQVVRHARAQDQSTSTASCTSARSRLGRSLASAVAHARARRSAKPATTFAAPRDAPSTLPDDLLERIVVRSTWRRAWRTWTEMRRGCERCASSVASSPRGQRRRVTRMIVGVTGAARSLLGDLPARSRPTCRPSSTPPGSRCATPSRCKSPGGTRTSACASCSKRATNACPTRVRTSTRGIGALCCGESRQRRLRRRTGCGTGAVGFFLKKTTRLVFIVNTHTRTHTRTRALTPPTRAGASV